MPPLRLLAIVMLVLAQVACAAPVLPAIFGDHMVLQRGRPVAVWGKADPGETLEVSLGAERRRATAAADGTWSVELPALEASATPRSLRISGSTTVEFQDVLVGEVWLCSGQSNMEKQIGPRAGQKPTDNWEQELAASDCPTLRLFQMPRKGVLKAPAVGLCWVPSTPANLKATGFSAAGWHFGRELARVLGVPVGLIHSSFGGTRIEPWTPHEAFSRVPSLAVFAESPAGTKVDGIETSTLYGTMIAPLAPYTLKGFIWYQGESNCMNADTWIYTDKMRALIEGWRAAWKDEKAPFYFVHLAPWLYSKRETKVHPLTELALPMLWEAQVKALEIPHTGLVPSSDVSPDVTDIHPTNKRDIGLRLARLALSRDYGVPLGQVEAPRFHRLKEDKGSLRIHFLNAKGGLRTRDDRAPGPFSVAGEDGVFHPAEARIEGENVILSSSAVARPVAARHAFHEAAFPNLMNAEGLPALPFRTDDWKVEVERAAAPEAKSPPSAPAGHQQK